MFEGNPLLTKKMRSELGSQAMTMEGTIHRTGLLLLVCCLTAFYTYGLNPGENFMLSFGGLLVGFVLSLIIIFNQKTAPWLSPIYAACEGLVLGGVSKMADLEYPGIAIEAILGTFGVLFTMLVLYRSKVIKVDDRFISVVLAGLVAVCLIYFADIILGLFGIVLPVVNESSPLGILFSLAVVVLAGLCLVIDFDQIDTAVRNRAPKYMEWYCAFSLLVTLVWLYLEVLRLLRKIKEK